MIWGWSRRIWVGCCRLIVISWLWGSSLTQKWTIKSGWGDFRVSPQRPKALRLKHFNLDARRIFIFPFGYLIWDILLTLLEARFILSSCGMWPYRSVGTRILIRVASWSLSDGRWAFTMFRALYFLSQRHLWSRSEHALQSIYLISSLLLQGLPETSSDEFTLHGSRIPFVFLCVRGASQLSNHVLLRFWVIIWLLFYL